MGHTKQILISFLLGLLFLPQWLCAAQELEQRVQVKKRAPFFTLRQFVHQGTGYHWSLQYYDKRYLSLIKTAYIRPTHALAGERGKLSWTFKVQPQAFREVANTQVRLLYSRPWQPSDNPTVVNYNVILKDRAYTHHF